MTPAKLLIESGSQVKTAGVTGDLIWFKSYFSNRRQRVVLPGTTSDCVYKLAGVPQGSILGHIHFLLNI